MLLDFSELDDDGGPEFGGGGKTLKMGIFQRRERGESKHRDPIEACGAAPYV